MKRSEKQRIHREISPVKNVGMHITYNSKTRRPRNYVAMQLSSNPVGRFKMSTRIKKYFLIPFVFVTIGYLYSYIDSSYAVDDSAYARSVGILILFSPIVYTIAIITNYILLLIVEKN